MESGRYYCCDPRLLVSHRLTRTKRIKRHKSVHTLFGLYGYVYCRSRFVQNAPLKPIQNGGGACTPSAIGVSPASCGGPTRGTCAGNTCTCKSGWTGPNCLAHDGSDPINWDAPTTIADLGFQAPTLTPLLWTMFMVIGVFAYYYFARHVYDCGGSLGLRKRQYWSINDHNHDDAINSRIVKKPPVTYETMPLSYQSNTSN